MNNLWRRWWVSLAVLIASGIIIVVMACTPHTVGDLSDPWPVELGGACSIYSRYEWDFNNLDHSFVSDRMMLVAEDIYRAHKKPEKIREYCETEVFG